MCCKLSQITATCDCVSLSLSCAPTCSNAWLKPRNKGASSVCDTRLGDHTDSTPTVQAHSHTQPHTQPQQTAQRHRQSGAMRTFQTERPTQPHHYPPIFRVSITHTPAHTQHMHTHKHMTVHLLLHSPAGRPQARPQAGPPRPDPPLMWSPLPASLASH